MTKLQSDYNRVQTLGFPEGLQREGEQCRACGASAELLVCDACHREGWVISCGHYAQPRPIAPGKADGSDLHHTYCADCA